MSAGGGGARFREIGIVVCGVVVMEDVRLIAVVG